MAAHPLKGMTELTFTPLRISTLVTTGHLGTTIRLDDLFKQIKDSLIPIGYPDEGFLKMENGSNVIGYSARDLLTKRRVSDKTFFNQSTIVIRKRRGEGEDFKEVNVKLFANGGFQMTGVTNEEFSRDVILWMIERLNALPTAITEKPLALVKFAVQLLNSDYKMSALVKRAELHKILCERYRLSSTLETTIYQGVNTKYYYNEAAPATRGICECPKFCSGQGDGTAVGSCKRITIAIFQTGSIIITGARTRRQLDEAYDFINGVIRVHAKEVSKPVAAEN
jgi:TATA-box binding protein (TBP) (component of TFIID and TFIIIB)